MDIGLVADILGAMLIVALVALVVGIVYSFFK